MNMSSIKRIAASGLMLFLSVQASAGVEVGKMAPDFTAVGSDGKSYTLSELRGQRVILEWTNADCPYVRKHYGAGNMQALQKDAADNDFLWLSVISSAPGKQGHVSADDANALSESRDATPATVLLDESGKVGKLYGARTTPHMYIVDEKGTLVYAGGIDDKPTANPDDIDGATNYVRQAMDEMLADKSVSVATSRPYGCSVKYN
jgi:peroxiredoxin